MDASNTVVAHFTWPIANFGHAAVKALKSPAFQCAGYTWHIHLTPPDDPTKHIGLYLHATGPPRATSGSCQMEFCLTVHHRQDDSRSISKEGGRVMTQEDRWGVADFASLQELCNPVNGFIHNGTVTITAHIASHKPSPTAALLYDSKKETGFVGLKAQSYPVHYVNSLVQTLYHIPFFRRAVYRMPNSIQSWAMSTLELQAIFYRLQHGDASADAGCLYLRKPDGYHNVWNTICNQFAGALQDTVADRAVERLFEGKTTTHTSWDYPEDKGRDFRTVVLAVKGSKSVYAELDKLTARKPRGGADSEDNDEDDYKQTRFKDLPPVLVLSLERSGKQGTAKINDRYEFPQELDLDVDNRKYLTQDADPSVRNLYELHSVIAHDEGGLTARYYAFIRPDLGDQWYKFDDERVTKVDAAAVIPGSFGGEQKAVSACMLVYVRKSDKAHVMCSVREDHMAAHLQDWAARELREKQAAMEAPDMLIRVATSEDVRSQIGTSQYFGLVDYGQIRSFRVSKQMPLKEFKGLVASELGIPVEQQRYWSWATRPDQACRQFTCYQPDPHRPLSTWARFLTEQTAGLDLWLEPPAQGAGPDVPATLPQVAPDDLLLFFKLYDPVEEKLSYVGHLFARSGWKVSELCPHMRQLAGYPADVTLAVYPDAFLKQNIGPCTPMNGKDTLKDYELKNGDILCFQKPAPDGCVDAQCRFPLVRGYLEHTRNLKRVRFRSLATPTEDAFVLDLSVDEPYEKVVFAAMAKLRQMAAQGEKAGRDAMAASRGQLARKHDIQLTCHSVHLNAPIPRAVNSFDVDSLADLLPYGGDGDREHLILYYEVAGLDDSLEKLAPSKGIPVLVQDVCTEEVASFYLDLPPWVEVPAALALVKEAPECAHLGELAMARVHGHQICKLLTDKDKVGGQDLLWTLLVEEVAVRSPGRPFSLKTIMKVEADGMYSGGIWARSYGNREAPKTQRIPVSHLRRGEAGGSNSSLTAFGHPFVLAIGERETLASVKQRVQAKLGVPDKEFATWKFAIVVVDTAAPLDDNDEVVPRYQALKGSRWEAWLGIEHPAEPTDKPRKRSRDDEGEVLEGEGGPARKRRLPCRTLTGVEWKEELFAESFASNAKAVGAPDTRLRLQQALAWPAEEACQLALTTQSHGRTLWDTVLTLDALRGVITAADEEGRRLSAVCQQNEAALMEAVAAARASPLDDAVISARDRALEDHLQSLRRLEEAYARKAALSAERAAQKERLEAVSGSSTAAVPMEVGGESVGNDPAQAQRPDGVRGPGLLQGANGVDRPDAIQGPSGVEAPDTPQGPTFEDVHKALGLAGLAITKCRESLLPAAFATQQAMVQLTKCLAKQKEAAAELRQQLDDAHEAGVRVIRQAARVMRGETPGVDAEQARVLQALAQQRQQQLKDVVAARKGLQPTEVRMGVLQRDLLEVRKERALAKAHLEIAELSEKGKEAEALRAKLDTLEEKQRAIVASWNQLVAEALKAAQKLDQYYPEAAVLVPERASQLSKALPGSSSQGKALPAGGGEGGDDVIDPDWSLSRFRNIGRPLGNSRVRLVEDAQGTPWVIKELCHERELRREGGRLQALRHPLVIRLERIFFDSGVAYLQMPYCKNGSLRAWFERIKGRAREGQPLGLEERQQVWVTMRQVFQAVAFIHRKGVVHRDLKPENILLQDDGQIALCDFGVSHDVSRTFQTTLATQLGGFTTAYAAPEMLANQPSAKQWPFAQDMWSLGVMLLEILTGSLPHWNAVAGRLEDAQGEAVAIDAGLAGGQSQGDPWTTALRQLASSLLQVGLFEQGREGREDVLPDTQLQEAVAFLPRKTLQGGPAKQQHLRDLRAVGRVLAKAVLEFLHVPVRFATALCCFLVGDEQLSHATPSRCLELMAEFDPVVAGQMRSVLAIAHGSGQEHGMMASMLTRCAAKNDFAITDANKGAVVRQAVQRRLVEYRREELGALREGFLSLDDLMADHLKVMTGEVLVTLFFGQDYLDVDKAVKAFVFPDDAWRGAKNGKSFKEWLHRFIREVSETGLRLLCLRALGSVDGYQSGHTCQVLPGGKNRELPAFERGLGCMYVPEACPDYTIFQARMHRALRAGEYGVRTDAQQEERLAREEMDAMVGAMRGQVRAGGWYRCPNGHPYAIGDCGGAMQEARCPTCGRAIGGRQHRLRADNQNALDIDGAEEPAWPQG
eukprot:jgi/Mesvir1/7468/Mv25119-RA.2